MKDETSVHEIVKGTPDDNGKALSERTAWSVVGRLKERG